MRRIPALLFVLSLLALPSASLAEDYYLSHVANGNYGTGSFRMTFLMFNTNNTAVTVQLQLTNDAGGPLTLTIPGLGTNSQFIIQLPAGGSRIYTTDGSGSLVVGAARVISSAKIGVSAVFSIYDSNGQFQTEAGVGGSDAMTDFMIPVDSTGSSNTGIALFHPGGTRANISLELLQTSGQLARQTTLQLDGLNHMARFVSGNGQLFPDVTNFRGTLHVTSTVPIAAVGLRQNETPLSYTSIPAVARSSSRTTFRLPQVANGSYSGGSFKTSFLIFNISSSSANVTLRLTGDTGAPFPVTIPGQGTNSIFNLTLSAGASTFLQTDGTGSLAAGAATITSTAPLGAAAIFTVYNAQGQFQTEAGVGDSPDLTDLTLPVDVTGAFNTGVAFFAANGAVVTMKLLDTEGAVAAAATTIATSAPIIFLPNTHKARFITDADMFPGTANFRGSLVVSAQGGIAALTLRQYSDQNKLAYTTLPVAAGAAQGTQPSTNPLLSRTRAGINASNDGLLDEILPSGFRLSGKVTGPGGTPASSQAYVIAQSGTSYYFGTVSGSAGSYEIIVPAGTYNLFVDYPPVTLTGTGSVSTVYADPSQVQVTGDTVRDISYPGKAVFDISGVVTGMTNLPTGASTEMNFYSADGLTSGSFTLPPVGTYSGKLPNGSYVADVYASIFGQTVSGFKGTEIYNIGTATVNSAPVTANFTIPAMGRLTGKVTVPGLSPLPDGSMVTASDSSAPKPQNAITDYAAGGGFGFAESGGTYELILAANRTYSANASIPVSRNSVVVGIAAYPWLGRTVSVGTVAAQDFNFPALPPFIRFTGKVIDGTGRPVSKVSVGAYSSSLSGAADLSYGGSVLTDASGNYEIFVLRGVEYTFTFTPTPPTP